MIREFRNQKNQNIKCCILFIDGMINSEEINTNIIKPIVINTLLGEKIQNKIIQELKENVIVSNKIIRETSVIDTVDEIINGNTLLLVDGFEEGLIISSKGWKSRAISEPDSEKVVRGLKEGFTESLITNLTLIRRKLKTHDLKFQFMSIGVRTKTKIGICYIESLANNNILTEIRNRLDKIDIDGILDSGYIQEFIRDCPTSLFSTVGDTERPDVVVAKLLEGRIAIVVDGSPFALTIPFIFLEYFQSNEDYYSDFIWGSINRLLRIIGGLITISFPAIFIALITFHQEMIPTPLLISISAARNGVPFPTIIEALGLFFVFEILRETGVRMLTTIGQTVSIVGALVLGQAAVEAKFVSAPMVIVIVLTGITGLINSKLLTASVITRLIFILLASFLGLYGYIFGLIELLITLMSMRSFGIPYMLDLGLLTGQDLKDTAIRAPWWYMNYRPKLIASKNYIRNKTLKNRVSR
ncbi:MAG: spore germination protein [Eubacteriaceae bacterium]